MEQKAKIFGWMKVLVQYQRILDDVICLRPVDQQRMAHNTFMDMTASCRIKRIPHAVVPGHDGLIRGIVWYGPLYE